VSYIFSKSDDKFKNGIYFPLWNKQTFAYFDEMDRSFNINLRDFNIPAKQEMTINNHLFKKVVFISSGIDIALSYDANLPSNVNSLYYDYDFGIIQFEDIDGKIWKVIYP
jgi:hypothetical protein